MKRLLSLTFLLTVVGVFGSSALAQAKYIPTEMRKGYASIDQGDLRAKITYLASDKLAGRGSLQPGDEAATVWIAGQFALAGIDPAVTEPTGLPGYLQTFKVIEYRPDRVNSTITLLRAGKQTVWHAPEAFGTYKHAVDLSAPVVFAGYGITAPELGYDDYAGIDATGKIVFVFDHEPQEDDPHSIFNGTGNTRYEAAERAEARRGGAGNCGRAQSQAPDKRRAGDAHRWQPGARRADSATGAGD